VAAMCFGHLNNRRTAIAIQVFSITVLHNIARDEPDLRRELRIILDDLMPYGSPGFRARARKILQDLRKNPL
jgi:hypothetical protein